MSDELQNEIELFCEKYNAVVLVDKTSNYFGKYKIFPNIICNQEIYSSYLKNIDLLIHIGNVSGAYTPLKPSEVWRVNPDGEIRDTFRKLKYVFEMEEIDFFKKYNELSDLNRTTYYNEWKSEREKIIQKLDDDKQLILIKISTDFK